MFDRGVLCVFLLLGGAACTRAQENLGNAPVIMVNGDKLLATAFAQALGKKLKTYDALAAKDPANIRRAKEAILREYIVSSLLKQYAATHDLTVTQSEIETEFDRVRKTYPDDLTFKASLASEGQTIDDWKKGLATSLLEKKVFAALSPELPNEKSAEAVAAQTASREYYNTHHDEFERPAEVHLQQIVTNKEDDAERLLKKLKEGASFSELAKHYSVSPDAEKGGDVGFIAKGTALAFDTAFNLRPGQMTAVIKSSYGFHIIKLLDKKPAGLIPYEKVKPMLLRKISAAKQQGAFTKWLEDAFRKAKVERNDGLLEKIKIRTEGQEDDN